MSVNIYDGTNLTPIAGLTVPAPTPDYVDEQFNPSTTYSKGMTCIEGNVRYRYKNSTATSGHRPPDTTYWEVLSISDQLKNETVLIGSGNINSWTNETANNRSYAYIKNNYDVANAVQGYEGVGKLYVRVIITYSNGYKYAYIAPVYYDSSVNGVFYGDIPFADGSILQVQYIVVNHAVIAYVNGSNRNNWTASTNVWNIDLIGKK